MNWTITHTDGTTFTVKHNQSGMIFDVVVDTSRPKPYVLIPIRIDDQDTYLELIALVLQVHRLWNTHNEHNQQNLESL